MDLVQLGKEIVIEDGKVTDIGMMFITFFLSLSLLCACVRTRMRILVVLVAYCFSWDESCMLKLNQFSHMNRNMRTYEFVKQILRLQTHLLRNLWGQTSCLQLEQTCLCIGWVHFLPAS